MDGAQRHFIEMRQRQMLANAHAMAMRAAQAEQEAAKQAVRDQLRRTGATARRCGIVGRWRFKGHVIANSGNDRQAGELQRPASQAMTIECLP